MYSYQFALKSTNLYNSRKVDTSVNTGRQNERAYRLLTHLSFICTDVWEKKRENVLGVVFIGLNTFLFLAFL